ncbi:MAG: hypothetical protein HY735_08110 [Verrucomicrobia bacterium]|nr:hypothetical protein [Verrucomicrobiota bacterium]
MSTITTGTGSAAIWERIIRPDLDDLSPEEARAVLRWKFSDADRQRANELSAKARAGTLTTAEERELDEYLSIESALITLKSKARLSLRHIGLEP